MIEYKTFETERLIIRPTMEEDDAFIFELLNSPKWIKNIGDRKITSIVKARDYIKERMKPQLVRLGYSNNTLIRKKDNVKIGTCGIYEKETLNDKDIGFALLPEFENMGYAYEAASRIMQAAFEDFGIEALCGITLVDNNSSQKLLKKLGMQLVGPITLPDDNEELLLFRADNLNKG